MRVAHLLRKYNSSEWGGTETAVKRLLDGLRLHQVNNTVYAPWIDTIPARDPFQEAGHPVRRYKAFLPVWGLSRAQQEQLISVGGNLMSFDLLWDLFREPSLSLIHTHALNRLGGIGLTVARRRRLPLVVTIHGGVLDLPQSVKENLVKPLEGGIEWGKCLGVFLRSRKLLEEASAIITCNGKEAQLLEKKYPKQRVVVQPHSVPTRVYDENCCEHAREAFPEICGRTVLLSVGRIDLVKNQVWLVQQFGPVLAQHPNALLVLVGACTDEAYGKLLKKEIRNAGLEDRILLTGGLPPEDRRLVGLFQQAAIVLLPSLSETFGLVILEAWAAGKPVISTRTSGACGLIRNGENGLLFDLDRPAEFHAAVQRMIEKPEEAEKMGKAGWELTNRDYSVEALAGQVKTLYQELIEEKQRQ